MKSVIIDFSCAGVIRILHARITSSVSVIGGYYLTPRPDDDPIIAAITKLRDESISSLPAIIIPPAELVKKLNILLPKMPDKEIRKVLPREIATAADTAAPMVFNYLKNGMVEDRQVEKMEISIFYCEQEKMFDYLNQLKIAGIQPSHIIPLVQGLKTLAEINPKLGTEKTGAVFLEMMENRISLNIFRNKYWGLEREFMFRVERLTQDEDLTEEDFTRISTELNRTFQYFKQRNRGYTIDQALLYGPSSKLTNLKNLINDNHSVTAAVIQPEHLGGKVSLPSHLQASTEFLAIFIVPIAVALAVCGKKPLDLYPIEYREKSKLFSRLLGLTISTIIIATILSGSIFYFEGIKNSYKSDVKEMEKIFLSLGKNSTMIMETKTQRIDLFKRRFYLDFPARYAYSTAEFTRKLSMIATTNIELLDLEMTPTNQNFKFKLDGRITAEDNVRVQSQFLTFYQQLKEFDYMLNISSSKITVNPGEGGARQGGGDVLPAAGQKESILYFTIDGEVEPE